MKNKHYALLVISICACYLFYKYMLQIYPSIITAELMQTFQLTATNLGYIAATFYYTYTIMQIFSGVLIDKYGTRWLSACSVLSCALGIFLFSKSTHLTSMIAARAIMGLGVAFATVAYMRIAAGWFPPRQYAFISGLLVTAAMTGAVFGQAPLAFVIHHLGWRTGLMWVGLMGLLLALLCALFLKDSPTRSQATREHEQERFEFRHILSVIKNKQNWFLALYNGLAFSPVAIFGGLWGNLFLEQAHHISTTQTASLISLIFIGLGLGSPLLGLLSDRLNQRRSIMLVNTFIALVSMSIIIYVNTLPIYLLAILLFIFGFSLGSFMIVFTIGKELNPVFLTATVVSLINTSEPIFNGLTEPLIGKVLDLTWQGNTLHGIHYFTPAGYHLALSILPVYLLLALGFLLLVKAK